MTLPNGFLDRVRQLVGAQNVLIADDDTARYRREERGLMTSICDAVVRPANADEIAAVVKACAEAQVPIVAMGGNTGLVGGGVANGGIILSTERLNRIIEVDTLNHTMTVEAGCVLADLQKAAEEKDCFFPLSLGAEGSCRIGGNISTNAGGVGVLRYGNTRDLVLGLEVVLPDGRIWSRLNSLRKDNTGYDLKHLFIGAEGTLGIVTKAVLKLFPRPRAKVTLMAALSELDQVLILFDRIRAACGDRLTAFEMIPELGIDLVTRHIPETRDPFAERHPWYVLMELTSPRSADDLRGEVEGALGEAFEAGIVVDAVFADSEAQGRALWKLREEIPAAQTREGGSIKHDVSVPVSRTTEFVRVAMKAVCDEMPGLRPCPFGHIGDGNIHFNLTQPPGMDKAAFIARWEDFNRIVHDLTKRYSGSISAEHGIGLVKRDELEHYSSPLDIELMRLVKKSLDPNNIMNPGKIFII
ncbi:MAG: putative D-lactate ferricytochrome oxidoreductase [Rhodospirillales bacterium]|nr:putative D-lactate ferricytochrome oxidoreductase [Rhodospirillales bacterium]